MRHRMYLRCLLRFGLDDTVGMQMSHSSFFVIIDTNTNYVHHHTTTAQDPRHCSTAWYSCSINTTVFAKYLESFWRAMFRMWGVTLMIVDLCILYIYIYHFYVQRVGHLYAHKPIHHRHNAWPKASRIWARRQLTVLMNTHHTQHNTNTHSHSLYQTQYN